MKTNQDKIKKFQTRPADIRDFLSSIDHGTSMEHEALIRSMAMNPEVDLFTTLKHSEDIARKTKEFKDSEKINILERIKNDFNP